MLEPIEYGADDPFTISGCESAAPGGAQAILGVTPDLQLDGAVLIGLTDEATDWTVYTGITVRR